MNFCWTVCFFWRSRDRISTKGLLRARSAEVHGEGMFAQTLPAFFQNSSFQEAVLTALTEAGLSLPAACWVCTQSSKVSKADGHCELCKSCHPLSKAISGMLLSGDPTLQSQGKVGLTSDESCMTSVKDASFFTPFIASDLSFFFQGSLCKLTQ